MQERRSSDETPGLMKDSRYSRTKRQESAVLENICEDLNLPSSSSFIEMIRIRASTWTLKKICKRKDHDQATSQLHNLLVFANWKKILQVTYIVKSYSID